jgi:hypothetical protein
MANAWGATTLARCCARLANERFCFALKRDPPDVVQWDMVLRARAKSLFRCVVISPQQAPLPTSLCCYIGRYDCFLLSQKVCRGDVISNHGSLYEIINRVYVFIISGARFRRYRVETSSCNLSARAVLSQKCHYDNVLITYSTWLVQVP